MKKKKKELIQREFIRESKSRKVFNVCNVAFLGAFSAATVFPFWYLLVLSFNQGRDSMKGGVWIWPRVFTLENYQLAFQDTRLIKGLAVSIFITAMSVILGLLFTCLVSYAVSVKSFPGRSAFAFYWYATTLIGGGMIPYFLVLRRLGLLDSIWLYVIPGIFDFSRFVMIRTYFQGLPEELRDAAKVDGAGHFRILFKVYMPLAKPMLATQGLLIGVARWNNWFDGIYYQTNKNLYPAASVLRMIMNETTAEMAEKFSSASSMSVMDEILTLTTYTSSSIQNAFVIILTIPIIIAYPFIQKYFVKGMLVGSVKG